MNSTRTEPWANGPASPPAPSRASPQRRRTIDVPTRVFHGLLALSFVGAYLTGDGERWRLLHIVLGYTMAGLLGFRVLYGVLGPRPSRLSVLWRKLVGWPDWLRQVRGWARSLAAGAPQPAPVAWRQGQNLLMAGFVAGLLIVIVPLVMSGVAAYHEWGGEALAEALEELHEFTGELYLLLVLGHLTLLGLLSVLRGSLLFRPMITGWQTGPGPDLVTRNRTWLGVLLALAVAAYWTWEWALAAAR